MEPKIIEIEDEALLGRLKEMEKIGREIYSLEKEMHMKKIRLEKLRTIAEGRRLEIWDEVQLTYGLPDNGFGWKIDVVKNTIVIDDEEKLGVENPEEAFRHFMQNKLRKLMEDDE